MRATSESLTVVPLLFATMMMSWNCLSDENRLSPVTFAVNACPFTAGSAPSEPAANCAFCELTALSTWVVDSP